MENRHLTDKDNVPRCEYEISGCVYSVDIYFGDMPLEEILYEAVLTDMSELFYGK